jgi:hypothetical protein
MKTIFCICLAALIVITGCSKPQAKTTAPDLSPKIQSPPSKHEHPSLRTSFAQFSADINDGFRDIAGAAGSVLYCVGYVFAAAPDVEYSYYPYQSHTSQSSGTVFYSCP